MIPCSPPLRQSPSRREGLEGWQGELARAVTDPEELLGLLGLDPALLPAARTAAGCFPLRVPRPFLARMRPADPCDPLLRQVLPLAEESREVAGFTADPVGDRAAMIAPGVLRKYRGRVLLTVTGACAIHCRYCFRRHYPYGEANALADGGGAALAALAADPTAAEVILSGGDPLLLADRRLGDLVSRLAAIPHLRRLRVHTRVPVVLPERVGPALVAALTATRLPVVLVLHVNHPQEIDGPVREAVDMLRRVGITLLNQAVLLQGVNDEVDVLAGLSEALFEAGVLPYYLHVLDRVAGAVHFEVPEDRAWRLSADLRARLPGYLVPRVVREVRGADAKLPVLASWGIVDHS